MEWLNYHHLFYFSVIAQEGGVAPAARKLRLTHSTLSTQLRALEAHFGAPLFDRKGKRLVLTTFGAEAASYAADIFRLGRELNDVARGRGRLGRDILRVGLVASIPKSLAHQLLRPALAQEHLTTFIRQDSSAALLEGLVAGRLNVVLTNEVPTAPSGTRLQSHALGKTAILLYGRSALAKRAKRDFPRTLSGVPFLMPPSGTPLRKRLDEWLLQRDLHPTVKAEVDDAGLLRALGAGGHGVFPVRAALRTEAEDLRDVQLIGPCDGLHEGYYAVTMDRRIRHSAVAALVAGARGALGGTDGYAVSTRR